LYHLEEGIKKSSRKRYLQNSDYGAHGFLSLQLSPMYNLEEGNMKSSENRYLENSNYCTRGLWSL